ncbi:hypothetical protein FQR65_LT17307 [Abscondita terminalis]|nr:hypothetical protein FQR65_LT17307 [Abscondita terminalis]
MEPEMNQPINYQLFKIELDTIPVFDGEETQLNAFCKACDNIYARYKSVAEVQTVIRAAIFSKFKGKALEILSPRDDLNDWNQIKTAIIEYFSDSLTIPYQIAMQIRSRKPSNLEQAITFAQDEINFAQRLGQHLSLVNNP